MTYDEITGQSFSMVRFVQLFQNNDRPLSFHLLSLNSVSLFDGIIEYIV